MLALLPEGELKRKFILDCTGCHTMDTQLAFPMGRARSRADWEAIVDRMIGMAGGGSSFPVIAADRNAAETADWVYGALSGPEALGDGWPAPFRVGARSGPPVEITEFTYPYATDLPHDLWVAPDGRVVITGMFSHRMLALDPASGGYEEIPIPVAGANPRALEIDRQGHWWVLLGAPGRIARYRPEVGEWDLFPVGLYAHDVRYDRRDRAWFNGHFSRDPSILGYVDVATGEVTRIATPDLGDGRDTGPVPYGLTVGPDGTIWGTSLQGNRIFRYFPEQKRFVVRALPTPFSGPRRIEADGRGRLWIPAYSANRLVLYDPDSDRFTEFELPIADALPYVVRIDRPRDRIWLATAGADAVLRFHEAEGRFDVHMLPTRGALIRHMDIDASNGDVWVAYGASPGIPPKIARLRPGS